MPLFELRGLGKTFGGLQVLRELDLVVEEREIVSLIGPNGAGKTTVFNVITGVYPPDQGDVLLGGESIVGLTLNEAVRRMRGNAGTDITVTVAREGTDPFDVTLRREIINVRGPWAAPDLRTGPPIDKALQYGPPNPG